MTRAMNAIVLCIVTIAVLVFDGMPGLHGIGLGREEGDALEWGGFHRLGALHS